MWNLGNNNRADVNLVARVARQTKLVAVTNHPHHSYPWLCSPSHSRSGCVQGKWNLCTAQAALGCIPFLNCISQTGAVSAWLNEYINLYTVRYSIQHRVQSTCKLLLLSHPQKSLFYGVLLRCPIPEYSTLGPTFCTVPRHSKLPKPPIQYGRNSLVPHIQVAVPAPLLLNNAIFSLLNK